MAGELSEYELERLRNIKRNEEMMAQIGIFSAVAATREVKKKTERKRPVEKPKQAPVRPGSRRLRGEAASDEVEDHNVAEKNKNPAHPLENASNLPRISHEQMKKLDEIEPSLPLSDEEVEAVRLAQLDLDNGEAPSGYYPTEGKSEEKKRKLLKQIAVERGLRWPKWLADIEATLTMGTTKTSVDNTMLCLERGACGLGMTYHAWPEGVGVLLADEEHPEAAEAAQATAAEESARCSSEGPPPKRAKSAAAAPRPRLLSLGSDSEALRREGQWLEHRFGRDAGNGWAYKHGTRKLYHYQTVLLREKFGEELSAPSTEPLGAVVQLRDGLGEGRVDLLDENHEVREASVKRVKKWLEKAHQAKAAAEA